MRSSGHCSVTRKREDQGEDRRAKKRPVPSAIHLQITGRATIEYSGASRCLREKTMKAIRVRVESLNER
jgi:hypothetical protein